MGGERMEATITRWLKIAEEKQSDDIHLTPLADSYQVYIRYQSQLIPVEKISLNQGGKIIRYIKYIANMEVGEKRRPQDGALVFQGANKSYELRLSTIANYKMQESLVIRILHQNHQQSLPIDEFNQDIFRELTTQINRKTGLIIFSGPVSSGKTTTIYYLLRHAYKNSKREIITIEDPIEIKEENFLQTEINLRAGIDYDDLISASLRHHPDILVIGEVRTEHTAHMMIRAALTGHLVLATIHAKDTAGVIGRLIELGITKEQLIQTLLSVVSQRLVPRDDIANQWLPIFELLHHENLQHVILNKPTDNTFKSLNNQLSEALHHGYISQKTYEHYHVEAAITH